MTKVPRDRALDSTLALAREGYPFIWNRCQRLGTDIFRARVMGKPAVCIHGREAAELFYDETKLQRAQAVPRRVVTTLFGKNAVHTLDDAHHRHRKAAFLLLMTRSNLEQLMVHMAEAWRDAIRRWERTPSIVLFDEAQRVLATAACAWAGVPLESSEVQRRAAQLGQMVDAFGGAGPRLWQGKLARMSSERWIAARVRAVRQGALIAPVHSALHVFSHHREPNGELLEERSAAVEVLNVIRPTTAIASYVAFAAHALATQQQARTTLERAQSQADASDYARLFMQEVRRFYPFTPYLGAQVRTPFEWRGHRFKPGTLVLLDVYGFHRDPAVWGDADVFRPERFGGWTGGAFDFFPQGAGSHTHGHRCAGEWITMQSLTLALLFLTRGMHYRLAHPQDLRIDLTRMPTRPSSGVVLERVQGTEALEEELLPGLPSSIVSAQPALRTISLDAHR